MTSLPIRLARAWKNFSSYDDYEQTPQWLRLLVTVLFSLGIALIFTVAGFVMFASGDGAWRNWRGWMEWYGRNLIIALTIGLLIYAAYYLLYRLLGVPRIRAMGASKQRWLFACVPIVVTAVGWPLGVWLAGGSFSGMFGGLQDMNQVARVVLSVSLVAFLFYAVFSNKARAAEAERREAAARLQLLQAQIEPHFLFNTLANVQSLMDHDPPRAKQMLADFTDYLRASLGTFRSQESAVADELNLAQSYLQLLAGRMEDRLKFSISADDLARKQPLPPLLLQPLVENAIVHGLEPSIDGGTVQVSARLAGQQLILEVQDNGRGIDAPARPHARRGNGVALDNIRQRLMARYGPAATLTVEASHPGTLARICVPLQSV